MESNRILMTTSRTIRLYCAGALIALFFLVTRTYAQCDCAAVLAHGYDSINSVNEGLFQAELNVFSTLYEKYRGNWRKHYNKNVAIDFKYGGALLGVRDQNARTKESFEEMVRIYSLQKNYQVLNKTYNYFKSRILADGAIKAWQSCMRGTGWQIDIKDWTKQFVILKLTWNPLTGQKATPKVTSLTFPGKKATYGSPADKKITKGTKFTTQDPGVLESFKRFGREQTRILINFKNASDVDVLLPEIEPEYVIEYGDTQNSNIDKIEPVTNHDAVLVNFSLTRYRDATCRVLFKVYIGGAIRDEVIIKDIKLSPRGKRIDSGSFYVGKGDSWILEVTENDSERPPGHEVSYKPVTFREIPLVL